MKKTKPMMVMVSNCFGFEAGRLFGRYPDRIAHLHSVDARKQPRADVPWALDNGVYGAWKYGRPWSEEPLYNFLDQFAAWKPMWCVVPDWVGDRDKTLRLWEEHSAAIGAFGVPLAFAVQDGMTVEDVPSEATVVFVGGTTSWKWRTLHQWTASFPRVHVGRVNSKNLLSQAEGAGAESCDGTGWFRAPKRTRELESYLADPVHVQTAVSQ